MALGIALNAAVAHDVIGASAREAEALGYTSFWVNHPGKTDGLASLAVAAGDTRRVELGVGVIPLHTRDHESIESVYRDVLRSLVSLHTTATAHVGECPLLEARIFDYDYLRWETTYFLDRFVTGLRKAAIAEWLEEYAAAGRGVLVATHDRSFPADRRVSLQREELLAA